MTTSIFIRLNPLSTIPDLPHSFRAKQSKVMAGHVAHVVYKGPSVVKEIIIGISLGLVAGGFWKMHHWNTQRRTKEFYDMLEKGQISVVHDEE
ncbi:unnamed protein product [Cuscuta campestris]|uniref:Cytochrome c oxidase subunit 5C n=1 Tax=Cuscuta campestris TaxID=132261 RepID=A0A484LGU8_9ASTE|nr:unnamed protein product [Cuscuta campestris]